eukprot:9146106-Pyramimonas_sp.AAC.1
MFHSFFDDPERTNVGGLLTFFPVLGAHARFEVRDDFAPGRVLNVKAILDESGDCWISHWNVHNFGLSRE